MQELTQIREGIVTYLARIVPGEVVEAQWAERYGYKNCPSCLGTVSDTDIDFFDTEVVDGTIASAPVEVTGALNVIPWCFRCETDSHPGREMIEESHLNGDFVKRQIEMILDYTQKGA